MDPIVPELLGSGVQIAPTPPPGVGVGVIRCPGAGLGVGDRPRLWPADWPEARSAGSAPSLVSLESSMISPGGGTRGGVAYCSSSSPAFSSRCSDAMAAADIVVRCGLSQAEGEGWMLLSELTLCYHQNRLLS